MTDIRIYDIYGKKIIFIRAKEAADNQKPVYLNDKLENTWIRTGDGDRKATKEELAAFLRNAQPALDTIYADRFTLEDLDNGITNCNGGTEKKLELIYLAIIS